MCVTDFREEGAKKAPLIHEQTQKTPSWIGLKSKNQLKIFHTFKQINNL